MRRSDLRLGGPAMKHFDKLTFWGYRSNVLCACLVAAIAIPLRSCQKLRNLQKLVRATIVDYAGHLSSSFGPRPDRWRKAGRAVNRIWRRNMIQVDPLAGHK